MKRSNRTTIAALSITASAALGIVAACGSNEFTAGDPDAGVVNPGDGSIVGDGDGSTTTSDGSAADGSTVVVASWCQQNAPNAFLCADFDEGDFTAAYDQGELKPMFMQPSTREGGAPGLFMGVDDAGKSLPGALRVFLPVLNAPNPYEFAKEVTAYKNAVGATGFQLDFDMRNDMSSPTSIGDTVYFEVTDPTYLDTYLRCSIDVTGGNVNFSSNGGPPTKIGPLPTLGIWTHYRLIIQLGGGVTMQVDDGGVQGVGDSGVRPSTTNAQLSIGHECETFNYPGCNIGLSFDNVVVHAYGTGDGG